MHAVALVVLLLREISIKLALPRLKSGSDSMIVTIRVCSGCGVHDDKSLVSTLWCDVCRQHEARITGMRNFASWITGSTNHRTSSIVDHAKSEQHVASMAHMRAARCTVGLFVQKERICQAVYLLHRRSSKKHVSPIR